MVERFIPRFDFYLIKRILKANLLPARQGGFHSLETTFLYDAGSDGAFDLVFRFSDIQNLAFPVFCPLGWISELEVEDLSKCQLEGVRFQFKAYGGETEFTVRCKDVELIGIQKSDPDAVI